MIAILVYMSIVIFLLISPNWTEVKVLYYKLIYKPMDKLFPEFYDWEEDDEIIFMSNKHNDELGKLIALSSDGVVVKVGMRTHKIAPYQIKFNQTHQNRMEAEKVREFHEDILPILTEKQNQFPTVGNHIKQLTN